MEASVNNRQIKKQFLLKRKTPAVQLSGEFDMTGVGDDGVIAVDM